MRKVWKNYLFYDILWKQSDTLILVVCLSICSVFFACLQLSPKGGLFRNPKAFFMKITKGDKLIWFRTQRKPNSLPAHDTDY